jgi:hypothetical protein
VGDLGISKIDQGDSMNVVTELKWLSCPMEGFCEAVN